MVKRFINLMDKCEQMLIKGKITLYDFREIEQDALILYRDRNTTTTINQNVMEVFKKNGVKVTVNGIGWKMEVVK